MHDPLVTYLHDHLAGANFAVELLQRLSDAYPRHETGLFAAEILVDVEADREILKEIIQRVGTSPLELKDVMAWLGEKASRPKFSDTQPDGLGPFEALETLALGITGKLSLWHTLSSVGAFDQRLSEWDFASLAARAEDQRARVDEYRLSITPAAFAILAMD